VREAWLDLVALQGDEASATGGFDPPVEDWLGREKSQSVPLRNGSTGPPDPGWDPAPARVHFDDFLAAPRTSSLRHRISIDGATGAARNSHLQVVEAPFGVGESVAFQGIVRFIPRDEWEAESLRAALETGLRWIDAFGALRTIGFGRVNCASVALRRDASREGASDLLDATESRIDLIVRPLGPFVLAQPQPVNNLFESSREISGAALKGTLAASWREYLGLARGGQVEAGMDPERPALAAHFASIRLLHAFPGPAGGPRRRPVTPPLSLVKVKSGPVGHPGRERLYDVALCSGPRLIGGRAPAFDLDWKDRADVEQRLGWADPRRELRVRTDVNSTTRRAEEGQLFAYERVVPSAEVTWYGGIDLGLIPGQERSAVRRQLVGLLDAVGWRLRGLGKTKSGVLLEGQPEGSLTPAVGCAEGGAERVVSLQTAALLCDPRDLEKRGGRAELHDSYQRVWTDLSKGSLSLVRYFARQRLAGGRYLHGRFRAAASTYEPFLLTEEGSTFVLEVAGSPSVAERCLAEWAEHGLPLPTWAHQRYDRGNGAADWSTCPYLRENGFGEIAVDLALHRELAPRDEGPGASARGGRP
jgi:hypothetical protein